MVTLDASPPAYDESLSQIDLTLTADPNGTDVLITVRPPADATAYASREEKGQEKAKQNEPKTRHAPVDFVLTIDVSRSMKSKAPVPGENECTGLSVLDVVKHAANTIITTMKPEDRISIVSFAGVAKVVLPLTQTTEDGKLEALKEVESLRTSAGTNLWDGLKQSMDILTEAPAFTHGPVASLAAAGSAIAIDNNHMTASTSPSLPQTTSGRHRLSSIFLLTDGQPNIKPPRGYIAALKLYLESQPRDTTEFTINTFGFGYSLDSKLLHEIAKIGNGHFGFIADPGMVGTNFVHAVANTYATYAQGLYLDIEVDEDNVANEMEVLGSFEVNRASWGVQVPLGQLQYGQTRDVVVRLPKSLSKLSVTVISRCRPWNSDEEVKTTRVISDAHLPPPESSTDSGLLYHSFRLDFVSSVHKEIFAIGRNSRRSYVRGPSPSNAATAFKDLASRIRAAFPGEKSVDPSPASDALDLAEDITGEVLLGIADSRVFNKWGLHYLLSLSRSHQRQQCGNFRDPGLQTYGRDSVLFKTTRDEIDMTFDNLPPPKPSLSVGSHSRSLPPLPPPPGGAPRYRAAMSMAHRATPLASFRSADASTASAPSASSASFMSRYNSRSTPCFAGSSVIQLSTGEGIPVDCLLVGSSVKTPLGSAKVTGIVRTYSSDGSFDLCELGDGLLITPWHPVYVAEEETWRFPADVATPKQTACDSVYSLILEENGESDGHAVFIGGVRCVTMGHGVIDPADIRSHPFLSNHFNVMRTLETHPDFSKGPIDALGTLKDAETGLMCGFVWKRDPVISSAVALDIPSIILNVNPPAVATKA
ncbi:hypothetical protein FS837_011748 [Tulasnella sp. UAMH 9824]|nr:hypothetical protein FS837_011748 [Tulasnella sp. UAMH 9824]